MHPLMIGTAAFLAGVMTSRIAPRRPATRNRSGPAAQDREVLTDTMVSGGGAPVWLYCFEPAGLNLADIHFELAETRPVEDLLTAADPDVLPAPAQEMIADIHAQRQALDSPDTAQWNGSTVSIEGVQVSRSPHGPTQLSVCAGRSDYASHLATMSSWRAARAAGPIGPDQLEPLVRVVPGMINAAGLSVAVVTSDGFLVLARNDPLHTGRDGLHVSVGEGMVPTDRATGAHLSVHLGMSRGIEEELGVYVAPSDIVVHSAYLELTNYHFGTVGLADLHGTPLDRNAFVAAHLEARDGAENLELVFVPWTPAVMLDRLCDPGWINDSTCWTAIALCAMFAFPSHRQDLGEMLVGDPLHEQEAA